MADIAQRRDPVGPRRARRAPAGPAAPRLLYVGPVRSWWSTWQDSKAKQAQVERLQHENAELRARRAALQTRAALEREARRMGMVKPDERPFVVRGLPNR